MAAGEQLRVGVIMGSDSDMGTVSELTQVLRDGGLVSNVDHETRVISAHRTTKTMIEYAEEAESRGLRVIDAFAGGSAHLQGMTGSETTVPVIGIAVTSHPEVMNPALGSLCRMPEGKPLVTFQAAHGARGAGKLTLKILRQAESDSSHLSIVAGSKHELATMKHTARALEALGLVQGDDFDMDVLDDLNDVEQLCKQVAFTGIATIIAASSSSHVLATEIVHRTDVPVLGVSITRNPDVMNDGLDALLNDKNEPLGAFQGAPGAFNAGLKAARILGLKNLDLRQRIKDYNTDLEVSVKAKDRIMRFLGDVEYAALSKDELQEMINGELEAGDSV